MMCEVCGDNEATVHLTQVVNDQGREIHLCQKCASKSGLNIQNSMALADILLGVGSKKSGDDSPTPDRSCRRCQMRLADFKKTSRLGCPECYDAFSADLETLLENMHRTRRHLGKVPSRVPARQAAPAADRVEALKHALDEAISAEDYEQAARLRDRIRKETALGDIADAGGSS